MGRFSTPSWVLVGLVDLCLAAGALGYEDQLHPVNSHSQSLQRALVVLSERFDVPIFAPAAELDGLIAPDISQSMSLEEVLDQLLQGTGLDYTKDSSGTVFIQARAKAQADPVQPETVRAPPTPVHDKDNIIVIGTRLQNRSSINAKRASNAIAEYISSDEIGRLPDFNVADAARRAPGVLSILDEDEALTIAVRGVKVELNRVEIDGFQVGWSPGTLGEGRASRAAVLEIIPPSTVNQIEVRKSFSPIDDANAIGGIVNLTTLSAFDRMHDKLTMNASLGQFSINEVERGDGDDLSYRLDGTYATTFGSGEQFGLVLSAAHNVKDRDQVKYYNYTYYFYDDEGNRVPRGNSNGIPAPGFPWWNMYPNRSERTGGFGKLEWQPFDDVYTSLTAYDFHQNDKEYRDTHALSAPFLSGLTGIVDQTNSSGAYSAGSGIVRFNDFAFTRRATGGLWSLSVDPAPESSLDAGVGVSRARQDDGPRYQYRFDTEETPLLSWRYELEGDNYLYTAQPDDPSYWLNPENYAFSSYWDSDIETVEEVREVFVDYKDIGIWEQDGLSISTGINYRTINRSRDLKIAYYGGGDSFSLNQAISPHRYRPRFASYDLLFSDPQTFQAFFDKYREAFILEERRSRIESEESDYDFSEKVFAAYSDLEIDLDPLSLSFGLRVERTDLDIELRRMGEVEAMPATTGGGYTDSLAYSSLNYDFSDRFRIRAAFSQTLGRPLPSDLAGGEVVRLSAGGRYTEIGNPYLKPRRADNFDLAVDYFFPDNNGLLSLSLFHKDIEDDIAVVPQVQTDEAGVPATIARPENSQSAELSGIEASMTFNQLTALPAPWDNIGFSANATFLDGQADFPLPEGGTRRVDSLIEQPDVIGNVSLFYNTGRFEGRVVGNYTGAYRLAISPSDPAFDQAVEPTLQWDGQMRWSVSQNLTAIAEMRNLTNERTIWTRGENLDLLDTWNEYGRSIWFGISYSQ